ncbi:MAG: hypothetical protein R6X03_10775 [Methyloceanibacter sp.]
MKLQTVTIVVAGGVVFATPASAAPQWVEDACWYNANRVLPALNAREREAYIANCIADWTAGSPPTRPPKKRKKYSN